MKQMQLCLVRNKNKGFSLIEMVITVGIIAIIIVALATMGVFTLKKAAESNNKSRALRFSQESVEAIRYYRDVDKTGFNALALSYESPSVSAGNYVLQMGAVDVGWELLTLSDAIGGTVTEQTKWGCQDPVLDNTFKTKDDCEKALEPYFKRKIEVTRVGTDSMDFRITVWWENGNDTGIKGKKVIITTTLAR